MRVHSELSTVDEVAANFQIRRRRVYELIRNGLLPVVYLGRQIRIPRRALIEFIDAGGQRLATRRGQNLATEKARSR